MKRLFERDVVTLRVDVEVLRVRIADGLTVWSTTSWKFNRIAPRHGAEFWTARSLDDALDGVHGELCPATTAVSTTREPLEVGTTLTADMHVLAHRCRFVRDEFFVAPRQTA